MTFEKLVSCAVLEDIDSGNAGKALRQLRTPSSREVDSVLLALVVGDNDKWKPPFLVADEIRDESTGFSGDTGCGTREREVSTRGLFLQEQRYGNAWRSRNPGHSALVLRPALEVDPSGNVAFPDASDRRSEF